MHNRIISIIFKVLGHQHMLPIQLKHMCMVLCCLIVAANSELVYGQTKSEDTLVTPIDAAQQQQAMDDTAKQGDTKQKIVGDIAKIIIVSFSLLVVCLQFITYCRQKRIKSVVNFALFKSDIIQQSQNKFGNLAQTDTHPTKSKESENDIQHANLQQDNSKKQGRKKRKRKTDRLNLNSHSGGDVSHSKQGEKGEQY